MKIRSHLIHPSEPWIEPTTHRYPKATYTSIANIEQTIATMMARWKNSVLTLT